MIRMTRTRRRSRCFPRLTLMAVALGPLVFLGGCASWSSFGEKSTPLTGRFWQGRDKQEKGPGYDLYAESLAASRPGISKDAAVAARGTAPGEGAKAGAPSGEVSR